MVTVSTGRKADCATQITWEGRATDGQMLQIDDFSRKGQGRKKKNDPKWSKKGRECGKKWT